MPALAETHTKKLAEGQVSALTLEGKRKANQDAAADVSGGDKKKNRRSLGKNKG